MVGTQRFVCFYVFFNLLLAAKISPAYSYPAEFGVSPDNNQALLFSTLRRAQRNLLINIYEFNNPIVISEVVKKIQEGVCTRILIEGDPVGGLSSDGVALLEKVYSAMQAPSETPESAEEGRPTKRARKESEGAQICHEMRIMPPQRALQPGMKRRFRFNHAKYVVADGVRILVSSENFSPNGHPNSGSKGTRGWDIVTENSELASDLTRLFESDSDLSHGDVLIVDAALLARMKEKWVAPPAEAPVLAPPITTEGEATAQTSAGGGSSAPASRDYEAHRKIAARPTGEGSVEQINLITSPNSTPELRKVIATAQKRLDLNFMSLPKDSYILGNLADAARRGVHTRLLLNDPKAFGGGGHFRARRPSMSAAAFHAQEEAASNRHAGHPAAHPPKPERLDPQIETVKFALRLAHCDKIPIDAKIVDTRAIEITYIHNKGMILDDDKVLVSSINGTQNSMDNNREVAIFVQSADAVRYYSEFFEFDWARSPSMDISADLAQNPCDRSLVADAAKGLAGFLSPAAYPPTEGK